MTFKCTKCGEEQPVNRFYRASNTKRGHMSECKACVGKRNKAWINANREQYNACCLPATHAYRRRNPRSRLIAAARGRAARYGLEFTITEADLVWPETCPVLGIRLVHTIGSGKGSGLTKETAPSLDRIDNSKGYIPGNVIVVSWRANRIKSDAQPSELRRIADFYARLETQQDGQATLPAVQSHPKKETREVPLCLFSGGR